MTQEIKIQMTDDTDYIFVTQSGLEIKVPLKDLAFLLLNYVVDAQRPKPPVKPRGKKYDR